MADLAAACGYDRTAFLTMLESQEMREATRHDFDRSRALGVTGFPTLALARDDGLYLVSSGFAKADMLEGRLAQIERRLGPAPGESAGGTSADAR